MTFKVFTRSNNDVLFNRMREFIPADVEVVKCEQYNEWWQASDYLYDMINDTSCDWAVNVDIDCFIYDWAKLIWLLDKMIVNDYTHSGMSEGGVHPGRCFAWSSMNPFFNILNTGKIRELKAQSGLSWAQIQNQGFMADWVKPDWMLGATNCQLNNEPFHGLFNWLYRVGKPLFLQPKVLGDGLTTYLEDAMIHCWMSRNYDTVEETKYRIDYLYNEAKKLKK